MPTTLLDPTDERATLDRHPTARPERLAGRVALLDIAKPRGDVFLDQIAHRLAQRAPGVEVARYRKPTFTKPAPEDLRFEIARNCAAVIEALAD